MSWCLAAMISTFAPSAVQNARTLSTASRSVPSGGVRMVQRLSKSSAKPASGPECSVPATGCAGTKCTTSADAAASAGSPTPSPSRHRRRSRRASAPARSPSRPPARADRHGSDDEIGAGGGIGGARRVAVAELEPLRGFHGFGAAALHDDLVGKPNCRAPRAIDEPISPMPINARRLIFSAIGSGRPREEICERSDEKPVRLLRPDRDAAARSESRTQPSAGGYQAAVAQELIGVGRAAPLLRRENAPAENCRCSGSRGGRAPAICSVSHSSHS